MDNNPYRPDCQVGDTLRIEGTPEWQGWGSYRGGDTGLVIEVTRTKVVVRPNNGKQPEGSSWWVSVRPLTNQPKLIVIPQVSDKQIETTKQELEQLLKQLL